MDRPQRGRARDVAEGCGILLLAIAGAGAVLVVVLMLVLSRVDFEVRPQPLEVDRIRERLASEGPQLEVKASAMRTAHPDVASCVRTRLPPSLGPTGSGTSVPPSDLWCSGDVTSNDTTKSLVRMPGQDPAARCGAGPVLVFLAVNQADWGGAEFLVHSPGCTPTSWFDGDPQAGMEFVPLGGPWYAARYVSSPTGEIER